MNETHLFLTDYLWNKRSLEKLKKQFLYFSNSVNYVDFKEIIFNHFPEIARENEAIIEKRLSLKCFHSEFLKKQLKERGETQNGSLYSSLSSASQISFSNESSVSICTVKVGDPNQQSNEEDKGESGFHYETRKDDSRKDMVNAAEHEIRKLYRASFPLHEILGRHRIFGMPQANSSGISISNAPQQGCSPLINSTIYKKKERNALPYTEANANCKKKEGDIGYGTKAWLREARLSSKAELARQVIAEPLKEVFNHIDRRNNLSISWEDVLHYLIEESTGKTSSFNQTCRAYSFSRKMKNNKVEESWILQSKEYNGTGLPKNKAAKKKKKDDQVALVKTAWRPFTPIVVPPLFFLPRLIHSFSGHWVFALSTRSTPLALYRKSDLSHIKTFTSEDIGNTTPTFLEYLPRSDTILYYSSVDCLLRGWTFLLSKNNSTSMVPLRIEGTVQKMKTSSMHFPFSVFLATSNGELIRVDVPPYRSGTDLRVVRVYEGLHDCNSGGILDFAISETSFYTTGFDHRILSINIQTDHVTVIGSSKVCIYLLDYCPLFSLVIGASYQNELLYWDAKGLAAVPGTPFNCVHEKGHYHLIKKLICVKDLSHCVTIDCYGEVKMWDLKALECVQTIRVDGRSTDAMDAESIYLTKATPAAATEKLMEPVVDVAYFEDSHELVSCTKDTLSLLQYNLREDVYICDLDQVTQIFYDVRERAFLLQGSTRVTTWDASSGVRKRFFDRAFLTEIPPVRKDIVALCVDDVGSRIFISLHTKEIEVYDTNNSSHPIEILRISIELSEMLYSSYYKLLLGLSEDGRLFSRNEEEKVPFNLVAKIAQGKLYSLSISEPLGLLACSSNNGCLFLHDLRKIDGAPQACYLNKYILSCKLLESASILASAHEKGDIALWSCPPIAEVFLRLIVFNVFRSNLTEAPTEFPSGSEGHKGYFGELPPFCAVSTSKGTKAVSSPTIKKVEGEWEQSSFLQSCGDLALSVRAEKERKGLNDAFADNLGQNTGRQREITAMDFDNESHIFFCGDSSGFIHFFSFCPFFQWFGIKPPTLENRYFLDHSRIGSKKGTPVLVKCIQRHSKEGVIAIRWVPYEKVLLTSGMDRKVLLFSSDGNMCGALSKVRLPSRDYRDEYSKLSSDGSSSQLKKEELPPYELPTCNIEDAKNLFPFSSQSEEKDGSKVCFCGHAPVFFTSVDEELNVLEPSSSKRMTNLETSDGQRARSTSFSKYKSKKMSCIRLGDFVSSSLSSTVPLGDCRVPVSERKEVVVKASLRKKLASLHVAHPKKLSEKKVLVFPSAIHPETLSDIEELRPHSAATAQKISPVLFAYESEPPLKSPTFPRRNILNHEDDTGKKREKEDATLGLKNNLLLYPPLVPTLPPGIFPSFSTMKKSSPVPPDSPLEFPLTVKRMVSQQESIPFSSVSSRKREDSDESAQHTSIKEQKGRFFPSTQERKRRIGTLYRGKCPRGSVFGVHQGPKQNQTEKQRSFPTAAGSRTVDNKRKTNAAEIRDVNADCMLKEYSRELHRCIAGERAAMLREAPLLKSKLGKTQMGNELQKVDRPFLGL